jgi:GGDEF domain-containing protein
LSRELALLALALDHFKMINDTYQRAPAIATRPHER